MSNQLLNFSRYAIAFILVFGVFPYFIFSKQSEDKLENVISRFIKMVFLIIILGYILVVTKLFEILGILFFLVAIFIYTYIRRKGMPELRKVINSINALIYSLADGEIRPKDLVKKAFVGIGSRIRALIKKIFMNVLNLSESILAFFVFIYSGYLRLYDVYFHAAPALSDGNVTLAWMKYISNRIIFHDGIYPQGFHICLAIIQKFSAADPLYILKYSGPVNCVFISAGLYFAISRLTARKGPAIVAAFIYGGLGQYLTSLWVRQAATNSQEFSFVFVIPTLYFFYKYLEDLDKKYLYTAFIGITVTGLTHTLAFAFTAYGVIVILLTAFLQNIGKYYKALLSVFLLGLLSGLIMASSLGLGSILGIGLHGASEEFLLSQNSDIVKPVLIISDYAAICSLILMLIYTLFSWKNKKERFMASCFTAFGAASFLLYYYGGYITKSGVLDSRARDLWAFVSPFCIGLGVYALGQVIKHMRVKRIWEVAVSLSLIVFTVGYLKPAPIIPYKMLYDASVEQYLKISQSCRPTEWRIIGNTDMYALVYGIGYINYVGEFLNDNNPEDKKISFVLNGKRVELNDQDIFIFLEKKVLRTDFENLQELYDEREKEILPLEKWIESYSKIHDNISVYYEDENITVYHIHQPLTRDEVINTIW